MANDIIDINVYETTETVAITVNPNLTTVNINQVTGGGGGGATDLAYIATPTNGTVTSSTGSGATIPLADGTNAGLLTPAEKTKIANSVPYTGATSDVNLGEFGIQLGNLEFDNTPTNIPTTAGSVYYNDADGTLDLILKGGNVTLQVGQETVIRVVNKTATSVSLLQDNYQAVRITGAQGQRPKVDLAQATNDVLSAETIGLVTETIANNQEGFITTSGLVRNINTTGSLQGETWLDGDILYLSPTIAGSITKVKPVAPNHLIIIGYVISAHITQGTIFVKVDNGYELDELHNVQTTNLLNNQSLIYETSTQLWKNKSMGLQEVTTINASTTNPINVSGVGASNAITGQSGTGIGVVGISDSGKGIDAFSTTGIGVNGYSGAGIGVNGYSEEGVAGSFETDSISGNIANFKKGGVLKAAVQNDGKITATAGTAGTDVVVKSQLDTKQNTITLSAIGSVPNANAATLTGSVLNLQPASASFGGVVTTVDQTFAGTKTFSAIKFGATGSPVFFEYFGTPFFTSGTGATLNIGGGPGGVQNNLAVPNGTFNIGLQTASTIASFDTSKNVVSLPTATYPSLTELAYVKGVTSAIQTQLNGKVTGNTAITGATKTKITYDSKGLVTAGADIATTDISDFNSATRAQVEAELVAGTNITITPSGTGATRQLTIAATGGGSSSQSAFTMLANNTSASAVPTEQVFKNIAQQVYTLTPVWTATTAPSGTTNHTYQWSQIGNTVTVRLNLIYTTKGTGATIVVCPFPTDLPIPLSPSGLTSASANLYYGTGLMTNINSSQPTTLPTFTSIRRNAANTGYELTMSRASNSPAFVYITIQYFTT